MKPARSPFGATLALVASLVASLVAGLVWLAAAHPAAAATSWYHVEVVLFAQGGDSTWDRDNWREEGPPPLAENTVELLAGLAPADRATDSKRRHAFRTLPASALDLGAVADRLDRSNDYRVLLHIAWRQPGFRYDEAPGVHLSTLRGLVSDDRFTAEPGEAVDGTVRVWRRRFLHVDADLAFGDIEAWRQRARGAARTVPPRDESADSPQADAGARAGAAVAPAPDATAQAPGSAAAGEGAGVEAESRPGRDEPLRVARLTRSLRLRAGRLHYADHPHFGMLLMVKRLD